MTAPVLPPLESDLLRTFLAVADVGNFTRAAEIVGRTQSAVSMQIRKLEEILGEPLFARGARGVEITRQGARLLDNARRVIALLDETAASIRGPALDGAVRIGIPEEYVSSELPRALGAFAVIHPGVEVTVREGSSMSTLAALEEGTLDIAVVFESEKHTRNEVLRVDPTVWITSARHETHLRRPLPVATYTYAKGGWCDDLAAANLRKAGIESRVAYVSRTGRGLMAAVTSGLAVSPMSRSNIPEGCRELTAADGYDVIDLSNVVLRKRSRQPDATVDNMADAIREAFRGAIKP